MFGDATAGNSQVADVVESVEVTDGGNAVLLEQFGVQIDHVGGLADQTDNVGTAAQGLQVDIGTDHFAALVHHIKSIFLAVEIEALEAGTAADFDVVDTGFDRGVECGQEIVSFDAGSETGLESVTERAIHKFNFLHLFNSL